MKGMPKKQNTLHLLGPWYIVRYLSKKNEPTALISAISKEHLDILELSGGRTRDLTRNEITTLLPGAEDLHELELYQDKVNVRKEVLMIQYGISLRKEPKEGEEVIENVLDVSTHACKRWIQRKEEIYDEQKANKRLRDGQDDVVKSILQEHKTSIKIWEDEENVEYWLSPNNFIFVVGNSVVITLYKKDFGLGLKGNNKKILSQLSIIRDKWEELVQMEGTYCIGTEEANLELNQYDLEINMLKSQIEEIEALKCVVSAGKGALRKEWNTARQSFIVEFNRIFSRFSNK